jgi:hypothetical protein
LGFIEDRAIRKASKESARILISELALIKVFQRYIALIWEGGLGNRGLARLTWPSDR